MESSLTVQLTDNRSQEREEYYTDTTQPDRKYHRKEHLKHFREKLQTWSKQIKNIYSEVKHIGLNQRYFLFRLSDLFLRLITVCTLSYFSAFG